MKTFKTIEELMEYVSDKENIETLESGEVTLKDWIEDSKSIEKFKKDHGQATNERKTLRGKNEELTKEVTELKEKLQSVNNELAGLKEVHKGSDKDAGQTVQTLVREKSELVTKNNALESENRDLKARIPGLEQEVENYKAASHRSRILDAVKKAAVARKVPQNIIDDPIFFEKVVVEEFAIDEMGNIFTKGDDPQSVDNYIVAMQKDRAHWMPTSQGGTGNDPMRPVSGGGTVSDDIAAIAALFG